MKIRVLEATAGRFGGQTFAYGPGECDAPPALAKYLVDKGLAILEDKPKPPKARVSKVKAETRPVGKDA